MVFSTLALLPLLAAPVQCPSYGPPAPPVFPDPTPVSGPSTPGPASPVSPGRRTPPGSAPPAPTSPVGTSPPPSPPSSPTSPDAPPPGSPPSPGSGGAAAPTSPRPSGPGAVPGTFGAPVPTAPRSAGGGAPSLDDDWRTWWRWNREAFLGHDYAAGPVSGDATAWRPVSAGLVERLVLPTLASELGTASPGRDVHSALLLAYGSALDEDDDVAALVAGLTHASRWVSENAMLALGLTGSTRAAVDLGTLARGERAAQDLLGGKRPTDRGRAFAACALALLAVETENVDARRFAVGRLVAEVAEEKGEPVGAASAVLGLAVVAEAHAGIANEVPALVEAARAWLADEDLDHRVRAHAPRLVAALADGAAPAVAEQLVRDLVEASRTKDRAEVRAGLVQALGTVVIAPEAAAEAAVEALVDAAESGAPLERRLALLALGRRAGAVGGEAASTFLAKKLKRPTGWSEPWIALAHGLWAHAEVASGRTVEPERLRALRVALRRAKNPDNRAAWALALGLARDGEAVGVLVDELEAAAPSERGYYALALGLAGSEEALAPLRALVPEVEHDPATLEACTIARSLLADPDLSRSLIEGVEKACCSYSAGAHVRAVGRVRDARLVGPLVSVLERREGVGSQRAWAANALGRLAAGDPAPWTARFSVGVNYAALVGSLSASDGSGLLDLN